MRFRHVSPAGAPIRVSDVLASTIRLAAEPNIEAELSDAIRSRFGVRHVTLTSTGRAGLTLLLRALRRLRPDRSEVILPSYTCFSVAASVVKAGLRPKLIDVSPATLDYEPNSLERAEFKDVLAIIATNLYGLPNDLPSLARRAREAGVFLIDDAAQAMGASVDGRPCGTFGDAGLFSFDKGKNIAAIDGGVVVSNSDEIAGSLTREAAGLRRPSPGDSVTAWAKVLAYCIFLRPRLYWVPNSIPRLGLGETVYSIDFPLDRPVRLLTSLALRMLASLDAFTAARLRRASAILDGLSDVSGVEPVRPTAAAFPAYLRLPLLARTPEIRQRLLQKLKAQGIGASGSYPASIADIPQLRVFWTSPPDASGGRYVARHIVTLPTHPFVDATDVQRITRVAALLTPDAVADLHVSTGALL